MSDRSRTDAAATTTDPDHPVGSDPSGGRPASPPADAAPSAARISEMIGSLAQLGAEANGGVTRLAFTSLERQAHDLVAGWLREHGLTVRQDAVGNTIAELPGSDPDAPAIGTGSHLDSVPHGGRFDGIAGVVAAVEAARVLATRETPLHHPLRVVAFAGEEGARFGEPCIGSKAIAGRFSPRRFEQMRDADGVSAADAMRGLGLEPTAVETCRWDPADWAGFLELHIEQARVLEATETPIGIVDMVSGSTRVEFRITGQAQHTGGTPMDLRADALVGAAAVVLAAERLAHDPRYRGTRTTVGRLDVYPNSITTIPGQVTFTLDVRDIDSDRQRRAATEIAREAQLICDRKGLTCAASVIADSSPVVLPTWLREMTMATCTDLGIGYKVMASGASHDSQFINDVVPAGMVFVPSKDGLSHVPAEWSSANDIARGTQVLVSAIERLDGFLSDVAASGAQA